MPTVDSSCFFEFTRETVFIFFFYKNSPFYTTYPNECVIGCSLFYPIKKRCITSNVVEVCFYWSDNYLLLVKGFLRNISLELFEFFNRKITSNDSWEAAPFKGHNRSIWFTQSISDAEFFLWFFLSRSKKKVSMLMLTFLVNPAGFKPATSRAVI